MEQRSHVPSYEAFLASVHADDREHTGHVLRLAMQNLSPFVYDHRIVRPDGSVRMLHTRGQVAGTGGRALRLVGTCWDITRRWEAMRDQQKAQEELRASAAELRALATRLSEIREEERRVIARELHDQVGQALTALKLDLAGLRGQLGSGPSAEAERRLRAMDGLLDQTLETTRRISATLRPAILDDLGLSAAIRWQAAEFTQRTGVPCEARLSEEGMAVGPAASLALFRILQEALTNVARHAQARRVHIELGREGESAVLVVADEGRGYAWDEISGKRSLGLVGMRERALALGGETTIAGEPGRGTTVKACIPACAQEPA